jgi:hypothetical protein
VTGLVSPDSPFHFTVCIRDEKFMARGPVMVLLMRIFQPFVTHRLGFPRIGFTLHSASLNVVGSCVFTVQDRLHVKLDILNYKLCTNPNKRI